MEKQTHIIMLLDRSGSMESIRKETIKGFNSFIKKQSKSNTKITISLSQFDDKYDVIYDRMPINETPKLDKRSYVPRGLTALLDAIGITIKRHRVASNKLDDSQYSKTIFVIITDGFENASINYSLSKVHKVIKKMEKEYNWQFVYLGANQDAIQVASSFGIHEMRAIRYAADTLGTKAIFDTVAERVSESIRFSREVGFSIEDRDKQKREEIPSNSDAQKLK